MNAVLAENVADDHGHAAEHRKAADVDGARIANADHDPANWPSYGRGYSEQRFSPLAKITPDNAAIATRPRAILFIRWLLQRKAS